MCDNFVDGSRFISLENTLFIEQGVNPKEKPVDNNILGMIKSRS